MFIESTRKVSDAIGTRREARTDMPMQSELATVRALAVEGDPAKRVTRTVAVDAALLESNRILPPGAKGDAGLAYRMLRTQALKRLDKLGGNTLAVVSPRAGDGKSVTAINLAISIACDPNRTALLVEFDLRRPTLGQRWGFESEVGVDEHLRSRAPIERLMVRPGGYDRLALLAAGPPAEDSAELVLGSRAAEFVAETKSRYANRVILFDLPPALETDEVVGFVQHVDAALLVVREGVTSREDVVRTLELLRDIPVVGTVLNGSRDRTAKYAY